MEINKYTYLTDTEIDQFLALSPKEFTDEVERLRHEVYKSNTPYSEIKNDIQFIVPMPFSPIYIKRGNKLFTVKDADGSETAVPESDYNKDATYPIAYREERHKFLEIQRVLDSILEGLTGGSPYCKHILGHTGCVTCGAIRNNPYVAGEIVGVRD